MSLKLLLLEDNKHHKKALEQLITEYNEQSSITFDVISVSTIKQATELIDSKESFDAFLLDIALNDDENNEDGIIFANYIRNISQYRDKKIIFITAYNSFLSTAINDIHCYSFLTKPYTKAEFFRQLYDLSNSNDSVINIKNRDGIYIKISINNILYIQSNGRYLNYVTANDSFESRQYTMNEIISLLPSDFLRCHRSYIINKNMIINFDPVNRYIRLLNNNFKVPFSRNFDIKSFT